jgi:hypothetical protein
MIEKTKLEEISSELPEQERRELLAKITRSMDRDEREEVERVELKQEEREKIIAEDMDRASPWERFLLWLKSLLTGRSKRDLFIDSRIGQLKRSIRQKSPGITGFETRNLTPKFARQLFDLYSAAFPLRGLFQAFSRDAEFRQAFLNRLFETRYPEARKELEELVSLEDMEVAFIAGGEEEVRRLVLRRFNDYLKRIPDRLFQQLEEGLKPLVFFRGLASFPFTLVFRHFNYYPGERLDEKYPDFDHGSAMLMLDLLERLYGALGLAARLGAEWFCHVELLGFYCRFRRGGLEPPEPPAAEPGPGLGQDRLPEAVSFAEAVAGEVDQEAAELNAALVALAQASAHFESRIPLLELLRFFRRDPYLRLAFAVPHLQLKPLYVSLLREKVLQRLSERIATVKRNVVERRIREIFRTQPLQELFFYTDRPEFDFRKLGLPYFSHPRSLKVLYNYLSKLYKGYIQEAIQAANAYVFAGNRIAQTRLMQSAGGLEELEAKILLLDRSLSPEEEDGKALAAMRGRVGNDLTQQKAYRSFITLKDKEARELILKGIEYLQGIKRHFDEIAASTAESVKAVLKTLHFHRGRSVTLSSILKVSSEQIGEFLGLLDQLELLEKGS